MNKTKRLISVLFVVLMMTTNIPVFSSLYPMASAYNTNYPNTHVNTGNQRTDIVAVAQTQVGYYGPNDDNKYGAYFNHNGVSWCAYFIVWCARQAGIGEDVIKTSGYASPFSGYLNVPTKLRSSGYQPSPGDLIFFDYDRMNNHNSHDHIAIVEYYNSTTGIVTYINGNTTNDYVARSTISYNHADICCYGIPNYEDNSVQRDTYTQVWVSNLGSGYSHSQAPQLSSGTTQTRYYFWYKIYDKNTGDLANTYAPDYSYSANMKITDSNGSVVYSDQYDNSDNNWISFVPEKADTYRMTVTVTGDWSVTTSCSFSVSYSAGLSKSTSSVSLDLKGTNSATISFTPTGGYPGSRGISKSVNTDIVSIDSSGWSNGVYSITLTGKKNGTTNLVVDLYENYTGNKNVVATATVKITVTGQTFKLSYDANGGTGAPSSHTGTTLTVKSTVPTRTGYSFLGWTTNSSQISPEYVGGNSITLTEDTTLYAVWSRLGKAPYWGDVNGDNYIDYRDVTLASQFIAGTKTPTTEQACFGDVNLDGKISIADITKMAEYNSGSISAFPCESVVDITVVPAKTQYTKGEALKTSGTIIQVKKQNSTVSYELTDNISISGYNPNTVGTQTLTVTYRGLKLTFTVTVKEATYTLSYNPNGGSGAPSNQTGAISYTISSTIPKKTGYTFLGWSKSSSAPSASYLPEGSITLTTNTTLYAVWKSAVSMSNGSSFTAPITIKGQSYYYKFEPTVGYTYVIYSTGSADTEVALYNSSGTKLSSNDDGGSGTNFRLAYSLSSSQTYYYEVKYHSSTTTGDIAVKFGYVYEINYSANGGSGAPSSQSKDWGTDITISSSAPTTPKSYNITYDANGGSVSSTSKTVNCTFKNWNTKANGTGTSYNAGSTYSSNYETTFYAQWTDPTAGTLPTPTRNDGYVFTGWYTTASGGNVITSDSTISADTKLYAHWSKATLSSITVKTKPTKTQYYIGESFIQSGLTLTATYSDGSTKTISSGFTCTGFSSSTAGTKTITVSYTEGSVSKTTTFTVTVIAPTVTKIAVKTMPTKTQYYIGESFAQSGLTLTATYSDGSTKTISSGFTCTGFSSSTTGSKTITVTYEGKTTTFTVSVVAATLSKIAVKNMPTKTTYYVGDSFNQSGLTLTATYSDGSTQTITSGFSCTGFSSTTTGTKTITVTYEGKTTSFTVTVIPAPVTLTSVSVKTKPTKTTYTVGESFDQSGLTLTATYSDGSTKTISSGFTCSGFSSSSAGTKTITVTYEGKTTSFTVTVNPATVILTSIAVKTLPTKTTYTVGEPFDQSGLTLTATYSDGSTKTVSSGFTCAGYSSTTAGAKTITVTYQGKTTSFAVTVTEKSPDPIIRIHNYVSSKTVDYRTKITFTVDPIQNPVSGAQVYWFIDGQLEPNSASETYTTREATKDFTVQAKYMMNGVVLAESEIETVNVKAGFFARLKAFFRALFGRLPKVTQEYLGIEFIDRVLPD